MVYVFVFVCVYLLHWNKLTKIVSVLRKKYAPVSLTPLKYIYVCTLCIGTTNVLMLNTGV